MSKRQSSTPGAPPQDAAEALQERIGYHFRDTSLLSWALTHSSLAFEQGEAAGTGKPNRTDEDNEQLEFLGDAVAGLIITELLVRHFPERREGDLTRMRAMLVSGKGLSEAAVRIRLGEALHLGRGEEGSGGRTKSALLADALEALIAAMYLDAGRKGNAPGTGLRAARAFVEREVFKPRLAELQAAAKQGVRFGGIIGDWKSALQELLQARAAGQPTYRTAEETGSDHNKHYRVEVLLADQVLAEGEGTSKKAAQQAAASRAYILFAPDGAAGEADSLSGTA